MDVFFETQSGYTFEIELGYWDTVLEMKQKIEKYQHHLYIEQCKILHNSRVLVFVSPPYPNDQAPQTEQSPVPIPSNSVGDLIYGEDLPLTTELVSKIRPFFPEETDEVYDQDSPVVRNNDQSLPSEEAKQIMNGHQDSPVRNNDQSPPSDEAKQTINGHQDSPVRNNDQSPPSDAAKQITNGHQDLTVTVLDQELQTEKSPPSNSVKETVNIQDSSVKAVSNKDSNHQVPRTEKPPPLDSVKKVKYQDSRMKVRKKKKVREQRMFVLVTPYYGGGKVGLNIKVDVNTTDQVKKLRNELAQSYEMGLIPLPPHGYFLTHRNKVLNEDQSFEWNGVTPFDFTVEIRPKYVTPSS
ncbi:hypothetical protein CARUB_v10003371mg [Capsella rubella]|uniref:Ubiquitin-like domain-containing protein n=1 Tax=Capsella rubella TaxID=81985 RepID=R0HFV3_9BRAS|nr:hypothetical protein CARUB_v10003371mg [Capsella rubella]